MSDEAVLGPDAFADEMVTRLSAEPDVELRGREGLTLTLKVGQSTLALALDNFYRVYQRHPDQLEAVTAKLIESLQGYDQARNLTSYAQLRERVFPMLKPITLLASVRERKLPMLVYRPFLADLIIAYVIDEPSSVAYINEQHLERWELSEHELHAQAIENLRRRTDERGNYTVVGEGAQRLIIFNAQDGYDATRLLLPGLLERWRPELMGQVVIGVPTRDFLIIFGDGDRQILASVAHQIQMDAANLEHGLSDQLFTLEAGQVREYEWE